MSGLAEIIAALRALSSADNIENKIAARASETVLAAVKKTAGAGQTPEGKPWAEKKTGGRAYKNAASKLAGAVSGNVVTITLSGPEVFGHFGAGAPVRQMIPDGSTGIPKTVSDALDKAANEVFAELTK